MPEKQNTAPSTPSSASDPANGTNLVSFDGNGNVSALIRASDGTLSAQYEYGPFGELIRATGLMARMNPFLFSTKFYDWETGFYYYGYRYYNPSTGRWLSRDPIGERGGKNLYGTCANDPTLRFDVLGTHFVDGGVQTVWAMGAYGNTRATFEKEIRCVRRPERVLGIFSCCRADLVIAKFLVKTWTEVAIYDERGMGADVFPRFSDSFMDRVIVHEAIHRAHMKAWHDSNLAMAERYVGSYSCKKCATTKAELERKLQASFETYRSGESGTPFPGHTNPGWEGFVPFKPEYGPSDEWWVGPPPPGPVDQPYVP